MATVEFVGINELILLLMAMPEHLTARAGGIVFAAADAMHAEAVAAYPEDSGNLRRGMEINEQSIGRFGVAYQVKNRAQHSWWFEHGTQVRHNAAGAGRGAMFKGKHSVAKTVPRSSPPGHVFIPAAERHRAQMYRELRAMLEDEGLLVTGDV